MKKTAITLAGFFFINFIYSQGISNISISPLNPTESDTIILSVYQTFTSSGCPLHSKAISMNNNKITSSSLHCIGMLPALCDEVDTFHLPPLSPGLYSYVHSMNSGFGMPNCTPGVAPDDVDSISFEVISISSYKESLNNSLKSIYPNPSKGSFNLVWNNLGPVELFIYDLNGKLIHTQHIKLGENNINTVFSSGIYFAKLFGKNEFSSSEKIIVN
ncbi:MAG: T9SS type A sorting domain-containing protein [Flavobacteriales bacterium]|nr:T9SS type A sorting domain-containing protein [Flavobacteriales bacterium]